VVRVDAAVRQAGACGVGTRENESKQPSECHGPCVAKASLHPQCSPRDILDQHSVSASTWLFGTAVPWRMAAFTVVRVGGDDVADAIILHLGHCHVPPAINWILLLLCMYIGATTSTCTILLYVSAHRAMVTLVV